MSDRNRSGLNSHEMAHSVCRNFKHRRQVDSKLSQVSGRHPSWKPAFSVYLYTLISFFSSFSMQNTHRCDLRLQNMPAKCPGKSHVTAIIQSYLQSHSRIEDKLNMFLADLHVNQLVLISFNNISSYGIKNSLKKTSIKKDRFSVSETERVCYRAFKSPKRERFG